MSKWKYTDPVSRYWDKLRDNCAKKYDRNGHKVARLISKDEIQMLLDEAGITMDDVGRRRDQYQLARYDDLGDYAYGNCRFITQDQNRKESTLSPEGRKRLSESLKQRHIEGKITGTKGKKWSRPPVSEETRSKLSRATTAYHKRKSKETS